MNIERLIKTKLGVANWISLARIFIIPVFLGTLICYTPDKGYLRWIALLIFLLAMISDVADGLVARLFSGKTGLGALLDPIADKLLLVAGFITVYFIQNTKDFTPVPLALLLLVVGREIVIISGTIFVHFVTGSWKVRPTLAGKATTFFQMVCIAAVISGLKYIGVIFVVTACFTFISGIEYMFHGLFRINKTGFRL